MKKQLQTLTPLPIKFDKESHRYIWEPTGEIFTHSVTGITGFDMDEKKKIAIERTKKYIYKRFPGLKNLPITESKVCQYENSIDGNFIIEKHSLSNDVLIIFFKSPSPKSKYFCFS